MPWPGRRPAGSGNQRVATVANDRNPVQHVVGNVPDKAGQPVELIMLHTDPASPAHIVNDRMFTSNPPGTTATRLYFAQHKDRGRSEPIY